MTASLVLLAIGLAADAFAVAICQGAAARTRVWRTALGAGLAFGGAQTVAPLLGWLLGVAFVGLVAGWDHRVAFGLLTLIGAKMIWEGSRSASPGETGNPRKEQVATGWALFGLAVATSVDAAAAGITLPTLGASIFLSIATIGLVTFALSFAGVWIGRTGSRALGPNAEIIGGLILIVIGAKVLIDHKAFG